MMVKRKWSLPWDMLPVIFALAWPTMLEQLLQTAVQYIDTAMVGSLGTQATAPHNCGILSYNGNLYINIIRNIRR